MNFKYLFLLPCITSGMIMPMTNPDGSLDVSSVLSHISLLEQSLETKGSLEEITTLKSQLSTAMENLSATKTQLTETQANLNTALNELREVKADLKTNQIDVAVLQSQLKTQCFCNTSVLDGFRHDVSSLKTEVFQLQSLHNSTDKSGTTQKGVTFTRWGRTVCPRDNKVVYKGYTGGTHYSDKASTATILCLPDEPIYLNHTSSSHDGIHWSSHIYGTEYETLYTGSPLESLKNEDVPCVVCESVTRISAIMVPARNQCPQGWNMEYWGYLMGGRPDYASAEYVCIDGNAEAIPGGQANLDGQLLYPVESKCGALPCPKYVHNWELTCVVCSK